MNITIKDIAKKCNVSTATVSRALSNSSKINEQTKKRVLELIKELGYIPNSSAQNLTKKTTNVIGVVIKSNSYDILKNSFFNEFIMHLTNYADSEKYYLLYIYCKNHYEEYDKLMELVKGKRVDGLIFLTFDDDTNNILKDLITYNFPFIVVGTPNKYKDNVLWVDNNNLQSTFKVTNEVIKKGYKNIVFLAGNENLQVTITRREGFLKALKENNYNIDDSYFLYTDFSEKKAYEIIKSFHLKNKIDAVITTDDILALGVLRYFDEINKKVYISGFNNIIIRKYMQNRFASFNIKVGKLAKASFELLISKINDKNFKINIEQVIETEFKEIGEE